MKIFTDKKLFWFLKDKSELDLNNQLHLSVYIQQILTFGKFEDIKNLLNLIDIDTFKKSFYSIKNFLPKSVRIFWEKFFIEKGEKI